MRNSDLSDGLTIVPFRFRVKGMQRSFERKLICRDIEFMQLRNSSRHLELGNGRVSPVPQTLVIDTPFLLSNSENRAHLKNFRNVDCVLDVDCVQ